MQMTKAAAVAILAYATSALAYYDDSEFGSIYAREAYPEPEADYDSFDLYSRDAEAEWALHPRDAYMEGFEAGLYARLVGEENKADAKPAAAPLAGQKPVLSNKTPVKAGTKGKETPKEAAADKLALKAKINDHKQKVAMLEKKKQLAEEKQDREEVAKLLAEIKKHTDSIKKHEATLKKDNTEIAKDDKTATDIRNQQLMARFFELADEYDYDY